ncbi:MAG: BspA family leucine-rich repeat surface protein, partial [Pseudomonadota bacterium]|nr:BspA family leucine-rich repeat surface protein [Pseudomonadota bacterium]
GCKKFNQPLNNWDVYNVTDMGCMFSYCKKFNQPLNNWDVSNVQNMTDMFQNVAILDLRLWRPVRN